MSKNTVDYLRYKPISHIPHFQFPLFYFQYLIRFFRKLSTVCHHDHAFPRFMGRPFQKLDNPRGCILVQISCRFICQKHFRLTRQSPGDRHALLLTAGKLQFPDHLSVRSRYRTAGDCSF